MSDKVLTLGDFLPPVIPAVIEEKVDEIEAETAKRMADLPDAADLSELVNERFSKLSEREKLEARTKSLCRAVAEHLGLDIKLSHLYEGVVIELRNNNDSNANIAFMIHQKDTYLKDASYRTFTDGIINATKDLESFSAKRRTLYDHGSLFNIGSHAEVNVYKRLETILGIYIKTFKHDVEMGRIKAPLTPQELAVKQLEQEAQKRDRKGIFGFFKPKS